MPLLLRSILLILLSIIFLTGCFNNKEEVKTIRFGTSFGHFSDMVRDSIIPALEAEGYKATLMEFTDGIQLNNALNEGSIDVNIFQHVPYLRGYRERKGHELIEAFQVPNAPFAIYAGQRTSLDSIEPKDTIIVSNDPSSYGRALVILESLGWIKLTENIDPLKVSKNDIVSNPLQLEIKELQSDILPRALKDAAFGAINGGAALNSGLKIAESLSLEPNDLYINWGVIREADLNEDWVQDVINAFHSEAFKAYSYQNYPDYQFPKSWSKP
ncbi:MetQ/NlpA family ABC transporter substrate-binding protein [Ignatzschineria rhizosphaerae]|uniref:MetQ/NlpA family ABC transporter substrate-binding protein n=1 Tax=Ignatzschineria rhizosphaerae TaxID=2923279 RepID=A0ABY3X5D7_9GAMM|nr:MetQ/NlpA family ABC transporter substrate-binding protein [Ignatzschineria rhizosphaerae]UNM96981.1 MetQ/NlpA family ABC transporter substrate-binding protein [Ignatzschineria rhizosphaerae]